MNGALEKNTVNSSCVGFLHVILTPPQRVHGPHTPVHLRSTHHRGMHRTWLWYAEAQLTGDATSGVCWCVVGVDRRDESVGGLLGGAVYCILELMIGKKTSHCTIRNSWAYRQIKWCQNKNFNTLPSLLYSIKKLCYFFFLFHIEVVIIKNCQHQTLLIIKCTQIDSHDYFTYQIKERFGERFSEFTEGVQGFLIEFNECLK